MIGFFEMRKSVGVSGEELAGIGEKEFAAGEAGFDVERGPIFGEGFGDRVCEVFFAADLRGINWGS